MLRYLVRLNSSKLREFHLDRSPSSSPSPIVKTFTIIIHNYSNPSDTVKQFTPLSLSLVGLLGQRTTLHGS